MFSVVHGFCVRVDYINRRGEQHSTVFYGSEPIEDAEELEQRMDAFTIVFGRLGRQVLQVQKLEVCASALPYRDAPQPTQHGPNVLTMTKRRVA